MSQKALITLIFLAFLAFFNGCFKNEAAQHGSSSGSEISEEMEVELL